MADIVTINAATGERIERDFSEEELAQQAAYRVAAEEMETALAAKEVARQSAVSKLEALGLTVDEISAAFGLGGK